MRNPTNFEIKMKCADDITYLSTNPLSNDNIKKELTQKLEKRGLIINETKTEEHVISRQDDEWKKCKLLGTLLDTENDIDRRKGLAIIAINNLKSIFEEKISLQIKLRSFDCYISSIFLYNSELWTLSESVKLTIDSFHRRLMRGTFLNTKWPDKMTNDDVYLATGVRPWSRVIGERQLHWFGHLVRLPDDSPARLALSYTLKEEPKPRGRPKFTWIKIMSNIFNSNNRSWNEAIESAKDRKEWKRIVKRIAP